jgi:hypothetical protein
MDTILNNTPGENYFDTHALADFVYAIVDEFAYAEGCSQRPQNSKFPFSESFRSSRKEFG